LQYHVIPAHIAQEANILLETIRKFGPGFEERILNVIRRSVVEEVKQIFRKVMEEVAKKNSAMEPYPTLYRDNEIWVHVTYRSEY